MKKLLFILAIALALGSCEEFKKGYEDGKATAEAEAMKADSIANLPAVELYVFDGGSITALKKELFAQGGTYAGEQQKLASPFYVVKHPKGMLLWDTGLPEGLVGNGDVTPDGAPFVISRPDSIVNQLKEFDMSTKDIDMIAFSHVHFDHTGAANNFPDATWLVQQTEMDFINSDKIEGNTFYAPPSFSKLANPQLLNGDHDVFGDGSVVIKYYPGHTAGHQALFLNLPENGPVMLSGDTYHFEQNREDQIVPQFNYDLEQSAASIKAFEDFVASKDAKVIIQHDAEDFSKSLQTNPMK
jgi:glyoxylase-like metal-dependent hydrolase (beta-lactamase superfamily II)